MPGGVSALSLFLFQGDFGSRGEIGQDLRPLFFNYHSCGYNEYIFVLSMSAHYLLLRFQSILCLSFKNGSMVNETIGTFVFFFFLKKNIL